MNLRQNRGAWVLVFALLLKAVVLPLAQPAFAERGDGIWIAICSGSVVKYVCLDAPETPVQVDKDSQEQHASFEACSQYNPPLDLFAGFWTAAPSNLKSAPIFAAFSMASQSPILGKHRARGPPDLS